MYTLDEVVALTRKVIAENPDKVNPTNPDGECLYTHAENTDWHCIAGQMLDELNEEVPDADICSSFVELYDFGFDINHRFTNEAIDFINTLQMVADGGRYPNEEINNFEHPRSPQKWGEIDLERILNG